MSVPSQSMPPVPQYASSTASLTPTTTSTTTMNSNSAGANMAAGPASTVRQTDAVNLTSNNNSADPNAGANNAAASGAVSGGAGGDWRDKDADRSARQQIARIILTLIMKSANRPASVNYNPREIARRLEHTLYMSASSRDEYSNVQTLKSRLQQALDNSRRRQMQQQQQQQPSPTTSQAPDGLQQQQVQAQNQAQQLQLLHRQQQQMAALQQRNSFQGIPFSASPVQMPQQAVASQPLQMPISVSQMPVNSQAGLSIPSGVTTSTTSATSAAAGQGGGSSILDELEREADEMANGISDEPIAMPESELQGASSIPVSMAGGNNFTGMATSTAASNLASNTPTSQFNPVALSMPPEISAGLATSSVNTSGGFGMQTNTTMVGVPGANGNSNLYHGMNLTGPQLQQIQQLQQMQTLRRMQQIQQLQQQQQQNAASMGMNPAVAGAQLQRGSSPVGVVPGAVTPTGGAAAGMPQMTEASIAQKREELKRRLIQLKHARTCTTNDCSTEYCSRTKALLAHVSRCANAQCTTIGCKSTRQLLSHFRKCRNLQCDVCSAIRPPMNETEQQLVLRRQQERLCMLRHASTCATPQCILPYCAGMKVLWKHICECHQRQCRTDHCISSRYVLSHFKQCNKMICEVCGPVRKAIKIVDSCRGNPAQLQMAASQCPEGVRGLIKIMNTTVSPNNGLNGTGVGGAGANMQSAQGGMSALQQHNSGTLQAGGVWSGLNVDSQAGGVKGESKMSASGINGSASMPGNAALSGANVPGGALQPNGLSASGTTATGVKAEAKDSSVSAQSDSKKKPLKLQTEKEKKLRRKEQAKLMKERAQAKALAVANGVVQPGAPTSVKAATTAPLDPANSNKLVVRGIQQSLRTDQHVSHQDISYLDSMTEAQLDEHIRSLRFNFCGHITLTELKNRLLPLINKLMESEYGWTFNNPVDPVQWNIPDYFEIIKCPMDLGTIKKRLENEHYNSVEAFAGDVRLVFENCIAYNSSTNKFNIAAKQLLASFDKSLAQLKNQLEKQLFKRCEQRREEMCQLCGGDSFKFAPCMLFCSGPCAGRIRRHTHYYSDPRGEHHWCSSCYKQMKDGPIDMATLPQLTAAAPAEGGSGAAAPAGAAIVPFDGVLKKSSLLKRKNSEVAEEPWVECDSCKLWYHQICALFNERNHAISGEQEPFVCPICVKKQRVAGVKPSTENGLKARRLPITRMARLIEKRVMESIEQAGKDEAERMGNLGNSDSIGFSRGVDEPASETQFGVTIREVLSIDKQVQIKPKMGKLLAAKYAKPKKSESKSANGSTGGVEKTKSLKRQRAESATKKRQNSGATVSGSSSQSLQLTYRSRCICVFQELDGVDVLIFTLYVQEYGPDSLDPNAGRVYVSYLDSVNYFQPKKLRTLMHQQVMLGFLEDCKNRGFHTAHIWSCPPLKGDDYIFFCKPENQKIPKSARLRQWYQKLLQQAKKDGLVYNISNLYAEYYMKKKAAHELPYFEGDYWPRLAEDLIKQLEEKATGTRTDKATGTPGTSATGEDGGEPSGGAAGEIEDSNTPMSRSPSPSEEGMANDDGNAVDEPTATATTPTSSGKSSSKAGMHSKSKKKRSKKTNVDAPASSTRSSTTKTRSKKGGVLGRPSGSSKNVINSDPLMQKLKGILEPQKDDFFVVDLHPKCHKCATPIVKVSYWELKTLPPSAAVTELLEAVKKTRTSSTGARNSPPRHYHHFYCTACYETSKTQLQHRVEIASNGAKRAEELSARILPLSEKAAAPELADLDLQEVKFAAALNYVDPDAEDKSTVKVEPEGAAGIDGAQTTASTGGGEEEKSAADSEDVKMKVEGEVSDDAVPASEKSAAVPASTGKQLTVPATTGAVAKATADSASGTPKKTKSASTKPRVSDDDLDDVIMPCEIFDTREAFLMYCQNNHCQFDQIRRAKHSSMMVLYHLFNQGTTGFTFSCTGCKVALTSGNRWNCSICPVFNLCDACNAKTKHEHQLHLFKVVPIPKPGETPEIAALSAAQAAEKSALLTAGATKPPGGPGRPIKRDASSSELKRAKLDKTNNVGATPGVNPPGSTVKSAKAAAGGATRKRKLNQTSPVKVAPVAGDAGTSAGAPSSALAAAQAALRSVNGAGAAPAASGQAPIATPVAGVSIATTTQAGTTTPGDTPADASTAVTGGDDEDPSKKQRRIHNIDPQLLLQLEHASSCTVAECTFFNCHRMRSMLKHGAMCEQRLAGPCVLCKRIVGLLSAHARQCEKDYAVCKVPRCADIRRHFLQQLQQRQEQVERLKAQQQHAQQAQVQQQVAQQQVQMAAAASVVGANASAATVTGKPEATAVPATASQAKDPAAPS